MAISVARAASFVAPVEFVENCPMVIHSGQMQKSLWCTPEFVVKDQDDPNDVRNVLLELSLHDRVNNHPNIVKLFPELSFIAYVPGTCCRQRVVTERAVNDLYNVVDAALKEGYTLNVMEVLPQIVAGLKYCHAAGIAHLDLKPENMLVHCDANNTYTIKICDFGGARPMTRKDNRGRTCCLAPTVFTYEYAAPEVSLPLSRFGAYEMEHYVSLFGGPDKPGRMCNVVNGCAADMWSLASVAFFVALPTVSFYDIVNNDDMFPHWKIWRVCGQRQAFFNWWTVQEIEPVFGELAALCPERLCILLKRCFDFDPKLRPKIMDLENL